MTEYTDLKVIVTRENWPGCTGLSAANAVARLGAGIQSAVETEYVPLWRSVPMRIILRLALKGAIHEFNVELLRLAKSFRPHLVLFVKGPYVYAETIRKLKDLGTCCICFYPDVSMMVHGPYIPKAIPEYDWIFTTKSFGPRDLSRLFSITNCSYLPHAADPEIHRPRQPRSDDERSEYGCDLAFIGGWSEGKEAALTRIAVALPHLTIKIWGNRWQNVPTSSVLAPCIQYREILGPGYALGVGGAKINLALVHEKVAGSSSGDLITSRTFHIPACGGFMLHQRTRDLAEVFEENVECAAFENADEAIEKISLYLKDETGRQTIAENGRKRVLAEHLWDHRIRKILDRYFLLKEGKREIDATV